MVFCFISYMFIAYLALGQDETILEDNFVDVYVAPLRQGQTAIRGRSFDVNRNA